MSVRLRPSPLFASVVSTASTRPLYGRGVGSIPAGGSSSHADVAQTEEHRDATPGRPVRAGPSACSKQGPMVKRKHGELQPPWPGFRSWQACPHDRRGPARLGYPTGRTALRVTRSVVRFESASRSHLTTRPPQACAAAGQGRRAREPPQGATRDRTARAATTGRLGGSRGRRGSRTTTNPADVAESGYAPASEAGGHRP